MKGFNLCGAVPMGGDSVSSGTHEVGVKGLKLYDLSSETAGKVSS